MSPEAAVVEAHGLGKWYRLRKVSQPGEGLGWRALFARPLGYLRSVLFPPHERVHAVRDLSFRIERGEIVALLGHNGAGKTTLLRLLSRITRPSAGRAVIRGRAASLLGLGAGFHGELSGRENARVNIQLLGLTPAEAAERTPAIMAFAELGEQADQAMKFYSHGMQVRVAVACALFIGAELLLVDELLAVADPAFRERALDRVRQLASDGAAVIYVSHHPDRLRRICSRGLLLERGELVHDGDLEAAIQRYELARSEG